MMFGHVIQKAFSTSLDGISTVDTFEASFKSFLTGSQDLKVNLFGLQQDKRSDGNGKNNDVGIAGRFPCCSYTVGPYGKGPTSDYTTCTYSN